MNELLLLLAIFAVSFVVGRFLILRVPPLLHTPLMSMTNAVSGVTLLGALLLFGVPMDVPQRLLGAAAVVLATVNVVGGFTITERMLRLFRRKEPSSPGTAGNRPDGAGTSAR
jgi:NAD(P) transhydrogenase subunit alpha